MTRELNRTETLTARTRHGCVICLRWIAPGERYVRWTGIDAYTGDFASSAYCLGCDLAWTYHQLFSDCMTYDPCCDVVDCLRDSDAVMAAALHSAIVDRWWTRPEAS